MAADAEALEHYRQAEAAFMKVAGAADALAARDPRPQAGAGVLWRGQLRAVRCNVHARTRPPWHRLPENEIRSASQDGDDARLHFLRRPKIDTREISLAAAQEISAVCRFLAWLDYFVDEERFMLDSLIELQAAERSGDVLGRVRGLATLGVALSTFRAFKSAWRRVNEATAIARQSGDPASLAMVAGGRGYRTAR